MRPKSLTILCVGLWAVVELRGAVQLASPFADHMVLQQGRPVPVWGTASPGEKIVVEFAGQKLAARADAAGRWRADLPPLDASFESQLLTVTGDRTAARIVLNDVVVGEVWVCGGQSNMERQLGLSTSQKPITNWAAEAAAATHPFIRQLYVTQTKAACPQQSVTAAWTVCSPATVVNFSAVGYFFARDLQAARGVPVGLIHISWGGTTAEAWTSREGLDAFPEFAGSLEVLQRDLVNPGVAARDYGAKLSDWFRANDPGSRNPTWSAGQVGDTPWETMNLPTHWETAGHPGFDGIVWFKERFDLPAGWAGRNLELRLSAIDNLDTTWVNGIEVGATVGPNAPRVYRLPATVLKPTGNLIAVRVLDIGGGGGIWNPALPFEIVCPGDSGRSLSLTGPWLCRFSTELGAASRLPVDLSRSPCAPSVLYNAMIAPLIPYAIRGVVFYQGESNADRATQYRTLFPALIADWRRHWGQGEFPFIFVQIAPHRDQPPEIREAQLLAWRKTRNTAMVVTIDVGDAEDIHPADKAPVGARLSLAARALGYFENIPYSGPVFESWQTDGARAELSFAHVASGLVAKGGSLHGFSVAGSDGVFHPAQATIVGDRVVVSSPAVAQPAAVRYGWANVPSGNLFNTAGLPASPFRTDQD